MDQELLRTASIGHQSSLGSSFRQRSIEANDDISETASEAGDIGDRSLKRRHSIGRSNRLSTDNGLIEQEEDILQSYGLWGRDVKSVITTSVITPSSEEIKSPLPTKLLLSPDPEIQGKKEEFALPKYLEYISCLIHLAVFGILGVMSRYSLQKLFGPTIANVTSDGSILYLDLPSNMVGSFLMGWFGVVFKSDIAKVSEFVAIGISTGYLGSLTTFSGWNQKMVDLSADGQWLYALLGFLLGLFLTAYSILFGIETAKGFKWLLVRENRDLEEKKPICSVNNFTKHMLCLGLMVLILSALLSLSISLLVKEFHGGSTEAHLWFGCIVAAPGVWLRWFLARLNGQGLGRGRHHLRWIPLGTIIANVSAAVIMAALATLKRLVKTKDCNTVASSIQLGLLGCLSTVSTFMAEFNAMRESQSPWQAYVYALSTISISFSLGILFYSVPVWIDQLV